MAESRQVFQDAPGQQVQAMQQGEDPALAPFLQMLDDHVSAHPERLQPMTTDLAAHLEDLVGAVDVDLNAPLETDGEEDEDRASL
ncbi:type II toxin-antitoxin system PrlF family antitoxin [Candidatus Synechococcus spongiarum]|uniref:type II toxin-antitoxin system PrlF family antitoxin n=1 Tax=Candidatus Synechococcus spongiarum TaxID=431041 RepID=UPI001377D4F5|nr:type II toxin-antitoxin system PrlF family antitoxin [Candidatus Synechococcus spongiarum]